MFVCVCYAVKEKDIDRAIDNGAVTLDLLMEELSVGTSCGCCVDYIQEQLEGKLPGSPPTATDVWPHSGIARHSA